MGFLPSPPSRTRCSHRDIDIHGQFIAMKQLYVISEPNVQEIQDGKQCFCATVCIDHSGGELTTRVGNRIYEGCRAGRLKVPGFPNYAPIISAMKEGSSASPTKSFRVSCQQGERLVVLEALAKRWVESDLTKERAEETIANHNATYNADGEYCVAERTVNFTFYFIYNIFILDIL